MNWFKKMAKTKDKTLFRTEWISVKQTPDDYVYAHEERSKGHGVAVLGWRQNRQLKILGRWEINPAHGDGMALCSLTGGIDKKEGTWEESALKTAVLETEEEAGIKVTEDRFVSLGVVRPSKGADTFMHLFQVELPDEEPTEESPGDKSGGEKGSYCRWTSLSDAINCKDPLMHVMLLRLGQDK